MGFLVGWFIGLGFFNYILKCRLQPRSVLATCEPASHGHVPPSQKMYSVSSRARSWSYTHFFHICLETSSSVYLVLRTFGKLYSWHLATQYPYQQIKLLSHSSLANGTHTDHLHWLYSAAEAQIDTLRGLHLCVSPYSPPRAPIQTSNNGILPAASLIRTLHLTANIWWCPLGRCPSSAAFAHTSLR